MRASARTVDKRLPGKGISNSHNARPVHLIITMIRWIRTSRLPIKNSLPVRQSRPDYGLGFQVIVPSKFSVVPFLLGSGHTPELAEDERRWVGWLGYRMLKGRLSRVIYHQVY